MTREPLELRPVRRTGITVAERDGALVLTDDTGAVQYLLNETARAIWDNCDGRTSVREIVEAAQRLFAAPADLLQSDVVHLVAELEARGLIEGAS